jgi:hypothetical protein
MISTSEKASLIRKMFGAIEFSRDNINVAVRCPACAKSNSKKKLVIRIDDERFHCWVCDIKGRSLLPLVKKYAPSFLDEYKKTSNKKISTDSIELEIREAVKIPKGFTLLSHSTQLKDPDIKDTIRYVKSRGLSLRDMWYFRMGTCLTGRFRRRVIIPSFDNGGCINYYAARSIDAVDRMKYINARVPKIEIIFNEMNIDWSKELVLVEGPFDLTKCTDNSTCLLGSHLSHDSLLFRKIVKNRTPVVLALDPDALKKSHNIAKDLSSYDVSVRMLYVPKQMDVGDMSKEQFLNEKRNAGLWKSSDRLINMIGRVKSGSIV